MKNNLKQARLNKGLTQIELSQRLSMTERNIRYLEKGETLPRLDVALKMTLELTDTYDVTKLWVVK